MASYTSTYSGDLTTTIISKIFDAANLAKGERARAEKEAAKYGIDPQLERGEFFKKALPYEFTPSVFKPKSFSDQFKYPDYFARGQSSPIFAPPSSTLPPNYFLRGQSSPLPQATQKAQAAGQPFPHIAVGAPLNEQVEPKTPMLSSGTDQITSTVDKSKPVKVKDEKLGVFFAAIAESLNQTVASISKKQQEIDSEITTATNASLSIAKLLSVSTDSLETKLDQIASLLSAQLSLRKKEVDDAESEREKQKLAEMQMLSSSEEFVAANEKPEDVQSRNDLENALEANEETKVRPPGNLPEMERGGIVDGPDEGYLVKLHGKEKITPIDNNYTQGQPSAVDGKTRQIPQFEVGTNPKLGDSLKKVTSDLQTSAEKPKVQALALPKSGGSQDVSTSDLLKAMELAIKVPGLSVMALTGNAVKAIPMFSGVQSAIKSVTSPVASAFGISDTISKKINNTLEQKNRESRKQSAPNMPEQLSSSGEQRPWWDIFGLFSNKKKPTGKGGGNRGVGSSLGTIWNRVSNFVSNPMQSKGLSIRGAQAGFTGMAKQGFDAIMGGDKFRLGRYKPQILGRGAYSAPTLKGAMRYAGSQGSLGGRQTPGGVVKSIVPGGARRINFLEPQAAVKPTTFDKGKILADKLLSGKYANSPLANKLRNQLISGTAQVGKTGLGAAKLGGKFLGMLGPILDVAFPEPTAQYDQLTGPNAWYNNPNISPEKRKLMMSMMKPPSTRGSLSGAVQSGSQQVQFNRMQARTTTPPPMVLNNIASKSTTSPVRISHIDTVGDSGVDSYTSAYSPYN